LVETQTAKNNTSNKGIEATNSEESLMAYVGNVFSSTKNYVQSRVSDMATTFADTFIQERAFATVHHNQLGVTNKVALAILDGKLCLLMSSGYGYLCVYDVDENEGGECQLLNEHPLTRYTRIQKAKVMIKSNQAVNYMKGSEMTENSEYFDCES
jgi:autophagy-related protein 18